jgi:hypothetical protein
MSYSDLIQKDNPAIVWSLDDTESLTSAAYISGTSARFTAPTTTQIFVIGQIINIQGVSGGNYNQVVTVTAVGGTSGAYTFTASGTGFTNVAGTGGKYNLIVRPDSFLYKTYTNSTTRTYYTGTYSNVIATGLPLIYGGKQSIKITSDSGYIRVPSLDKMSLKDSRNSSSLEFWVKLSSSSNEMSTLMYKKDVDNSALDDYATSIYVKNDYIVFRLGIATKYYEVSTPIDTTNKPLHIVAIYSSDAITLIVNGVSRTKRITNPDSLFPAYDPDDEYFYFSKPDLVAIVEYDCISLYSYQLQREKALKHFIYGTGYSLPSEIVNSNGGVFYNFSMDGHKEINKYDMGPGTAWSITEANNCLINNGLLTIKNKQEPRTYFSENTSILDTSLFTKLDALDTYTFLNGSYLEIENINSIIPESIGGWAAKFKNGTYDLTKKVLLSIGSKSSQNYIEFYTITESTVNKIKVDINGTVTTLKEGHTLSTEFYVGYYKDITGTSNVFFLTNGSQVVTPLTLPEIPSAYARFGSDNTWFDGEDARKLEVSNAISDSKLLKIVGIHKDNASLYDTYGEIEGENFKHYYTAIPNTEERRFKIKSYAQAIIDVDQQFLCPPLSEVTGACRVEVGHPAYSHSLFMSLDEKKYSGGSEVLSTNIYTNENLERVITSGSWLNKKTTQTENSTTNPVDALSFTFNFYTDDLTDQPPYLNYFRVASYALNNDGADYVLNNSSPGGNPAKIYLKSNECNIPDLIEMPFFYNGYKSGLKLKESYAKISHDFTSVQKFAQITNVSGGVYTLDDNPFIVGDTVSVSEIQGTQGTTPFSCDSKVVSVSSGNNITLTGYSPNGSYVTEANATTQLPDGTAGVMQLTSGISTVSFMAYIEKGSGSGNSLKIIKVGNKQFSVNNFSGAKTLADATTYVNGAVYHAIDNPVKTNEWQMITLVFTNPFSIVEGSPVEIILGDPESAFVTSVYIDQLMIFDKKLTTNNGLGSLDNLYNNFIGNIPSNFKSTKSTEVKLIDQQNVTVENYTSVKCDYLLSSGVIYNELIGGAETETLSISYGASSGNALLTKKVAAKAVVSQKVIPVTDTKYLMAGSVRVDKDNKTILGTVSSLDSVRNIRTVQTFKGSSGTINRERKSDVWSTKVTLKSASGVQVADMVKNRNATSENYFDPGAVISAVSGNVVTIKFGVKNKNYVPPATKTNRGYGLIKAVGQEAYFIAEEPYLKIAMVANLTSEIAKATDIYFRDKVHYENLTERQKLIISGGKFIKPGEKILVINDTSSKYFLYTVSDLNDATNILSSKAVTYSVTFTKEELSENEIYEFGNKKYLYSDAKLTPTSASSTTAVGKVTYKSAPQYAITE